MNTPETDTPESAIPLPVELQKTDARELFIRWSDGQEHTIPFRALRKGCQCAQCNEERMKPEALEALEEKNSGLPILTAAQARPLGIDKMHPVGNYAYNIHFSDGHSSGIFTFELLRGIGEFAGNEK